LSLTTNDIARPPKLCVVSMTTKKQQRHAFEAAAAPSMAYGKNSNSVPRQGKLAMNQPLLGLVLIPRGILAPHAPHATTVATHFN